MRIRLDVALLVVFSLIITKRLVAVEDPDAWPQFRGPNCIGVAESGVFPSSLDPNQNLIWQTELPGGVSSPCVWGSRIFVTAYEEAEKTLQVYCLDRATGKVLWNRQSPKCKIETVHEVSSPANATPATDGKSVCVYSDQTAFDFHDIGYIYSGCPDALSPIERLKNGVFPGDFSSRGDKI